MATSAIIPMKEAFPPRWSTPMKVGKVASRGAMGVPLAEARLLRYAVETGLVDPARIEAETSGRELEQLAAAYGERQIGWTEFLAARKPIEARIDAAKRTVARHSRANAVMPYVGDSSKLRDAWPDLSLSRQHAVVAAVLDRALIGRAKPGRTRFDEDRVEPLWRV